MRLFKLSSYFKRIVTKHCCKLTSSKNANESSYLGVFFLAHTLSYYPVKLHERSILVTSLRCGHNTECLKTDAALQHLANKSLTTLLFPSKVFGFLMEWVVIKGGDKNFINF